jgi:hypothetical protein
MNDRIYELARQADLIEFEPIGDSNEYTPNHTSVVKARKFARLIVQECLKIAKNRKDELESAGLLEESNAVGIVAYRISRQFGVKR